MNVYTHIIEMDDIWTPTHDITTSAEAEDHLRNNYTTPHHPIAFLGIDKVYRYYNGKISKESIKKILQNTEIYSLMKQEKTNPMKLFTPIISYYHLDLVQADLIEVGSLSSYNDDIKYLLCIIDVFTRIAYVHPLVNKTSEVTLDGIKDVISKMSSLPTNFTTDMVH